MTDDFERHVEEELGRNERDRPVRDPGDGWRIVLMGAPRELEILAQVDSGNWRVEKCDDEYELWLPVLDTLGEDDDGAVPNIAEWIIAAINGAMIIEGWGFGTLTDGGLLYRRPDGTTHQFRFAADSAFVIDRASVGDGDPDAHLVNLVDLALTDDRVSRALVFLQSGTWSGLYGAVDEVQFAIGGEQELKDLGFVDAGELERFKRTVNSFGAIQGEARHAARFQPPDNPMSKADARDFVRQLLAAWTNQRLSTMQK